MAGAVAGGILGQLIPYKLEGIDFCMTALFVIILMEQLEKKENRISAVIGAAVSVICLLVLGEKTFMPVSMIIISLILMGNSSKERNVRSFTIICIFRKEKIYVKSVFENTASFRQRRNGFT